MPIQTPLKQPPLLPVEVDLAARYILDVQRRDGQIPWYPGGKTDPWDHVECAMALTVARHLDAARAAYRWSRRTQLEDGSWWSEYSDGLPAPGAHRDANMSAYICVGVLHYFLATGDRAFLEEMGETVRAAVRFVLSLQAPEGQIRWAKRADGSISDRALLTGSSAIYLSLCCAIHIAGLLGQTVPTWQAAAERLARAIRSRPRLFDQTKARYAMDWYYPILSGALAGKVAQDRLKRSWRRFVMDGWGVRCVCDRPWVTMAETAELVMTLALMEARDAAGNVLDWIRTNRYENGAFWTGITVPERCIYTREQTTWTGAAVILATDVLHNLTPAWRVFRSAEGRRRS